jgi:hypothetical protein
MVDKPKGAPLWLTTGRGHKLGENHEAAFHFIAAGVQYGFRRA